MSVFGSTIRKRSVVWFVVVLAVSALLPGESRTALSPEEVQQLQSFETNADLMYNPDTKKFDIRLEEVPFGMALPFFQTLNRDVNIRITRAGFDFLAQQLMRLLYGWAPRARIGGTVTNDLTEETLLAIINNSLMGYKAGFDLSVPIVGTAEACIYLGSWNDDDGRQDNASGYGGGNCSCNEYTVGQGLGSAKFDDDCTECWIGADPTGALDDNRPHGSGQAHASGGHSHIAPARGPQSRPPLGGWNDSRTGVRKACMTANGVNGSSATNSNNLAWFNDPSNPAQPPEYWCKGPFYDSFLTWDNSRIDPGCLKTIPEDPNEPCPLIGHTDSGVYGNPQCDNVCKFYVQPDDPETRSRNDINISFLNTQEQDSLLVAWFARNVFLDGRLVFVFNMLGQGCAYGVDRQGSGRLLNPKTLDARIRVTFENGYVAMYGGDGEAYGGNTGGGGGGGASSARGDCNTPLGGGGGASQFTLDPTLRDDPLLGVGVSFEQVNIVPTVTGAELPEVKCITNCDWTDACNILGIVDNILNSMVSSGQFDATIQALLGDSLASILDGQVQKVLEEQLGLPIDFNAVLAGHGGATKKEICALRMPTNTDHVYGMTCDHDFNQPNNCDVNGNPYAGTLRCPGYGTCPCDDYDFDGLLNYQDPTPFTTSRPGWPAVPYATPLFTDVNVDNPNNTQPGVFDCNFGATSDIFCGAWNIDNGEYFYSWYYGVGNFFPDDGGVYYEVGAYANVLWDNGGTNIELSAGIVPWRDDRSAPPSLVNPYQGVVPDPTNVMNHGAKASLSGPGDMLWSEYLTNTAVGDPDSRSCYYDPNWVSGATTDNLWLDSTQRDRNRANVEDASNINPSWVVGMATNPEVLVTRFEFENSDLPDDLVGPEPTGQINDVYWGASNNLVIAGSSDGQAYIYRLGQSGWVFEATIAPEFAGPVPAVALSPTGTYAAVGDNQGAVKVYKFDGTSWSAYALFWDDGVTHSFTNDCINCPETSLCAP